jgi:hypothetical protein
MTDFSKIKSLFGVNTSNGFSESEISNILCLVGTLPEILLDYYKELGNYDFNYTQDILVRSNQKYKLYNHKSFKDENHIIICCENQSVCFAGIMKTDLLQKNPPVYFSFDMKLWEIGCNSLLDYIHGFTYIHAALCLDFSDYFELSDDGVKFIRNNFKDKNIRFNNWVIDGITEFYGDYDDTIMMITTEGPFYYASNNEKHFIEMKNKWKEIDIEYK